MIPKALRCLAFVALAAFATGAHAQLFRAYLSSAGSDSNPCTLPAPCRLLPAALSAVANGGEIWMLDSANYNTATVAIAKSVTILAIPGTLGSLVAVGNGNAALQVAAPATRVVLRNLVVSAAAGSANGIGIDVTTAATVSIEDSVIAEFAQLGLRIGAGEVVVSNSIVRNVPGTGIAMVGTAKLSASRTRFIGNGVALLLASSQPLFPKADVVECLFSKNVTAVSLQMTLGDGRVTLTRSSVDGSSGTAFLVTGGLPNGVAMLALNGNAITNNVAVLSEAGIATFVTSYGNNMLTNNATGATLFTVPLQ